MSNSKIYNSKEAAEYLNMPMPTLYKLVQNREIKFSRPGGQKLKFRKCWLDNYIDSAAVQTKDEIDQQADDYLAQR